MEFWKAMPRAMFLKSPWTASSLSDPARRYDLDRYVAETGSRAEPIPLPYFLEYANWFRRSVVGDVDERLVTRVTARRDGFCVELDDGAEMDAERVVLATGVERFAHLPDYAEGLPPELARHAQHLGEPAAYAGRRVAVIGAGQSALEWAVLLRDAGADAELITRTPIRWVDRRFQRVPGLRRLLYAPSDVGPAGLSRMVAVPMWFRRVPERRRHGWTVRSIRPAGAGWLEPRFPGVTTSEGVAVSSVRVAADELELRLSDGTCRRVDHLVLGTGYRPDLARLPFLAPELQNAIRTHEGFPLLDTRFQTSVRGLHVTGALCAHTFGPLFRFVAGAPIAARQVARAA
jgi:hypothetical protein